MNTDDSPALAEAVVQHAAKLCETADYLWRILGEVSIPAAGLTDHRQQHKATYGTEAMTRVYLYQTIYGFSQNEVVDHLETRPALLKELGLNQPPTQQNLSYAWQQFTRETKHIL